MVKTSSVLVVIVNYNGKKLLEKHLESVVSSNYPEFDIVVLDNDSTDDSISFINEKYPNIFIVKSESNIGFGRANNLGVSKYPNYDSYLFVNNDISLERDTISKLVEVGVREDVGAVGPKILYSQKRDGKYVINSGGMEIDKHMFGYDRYDKEYDSEKFNIIEEVDGVTGAAMLIPREVYREINGFNPKMFLYYEDVDICLRIKDLGYKIFYNGNALAFHDHMGSTKGLGSTKRNLMSMKNRYISIGSRKGFLVASMETIWYITNWFYWKAFLSKRITIKEYFYNKNDKD